MKTALLVVDVQQSLIDEGIYQADTLLERVNALIEKATAYKVPVFFIWDNRVTPNPSVHPALKKSPRDFEVEKRYADSFEATDLDVKLRARNVETVVVCGCQTEYCVTSTVRGAVTRGYNVQLVKDAHSTVDNTLLRAELIIAHHNQILSGYRSSRAAVILTTTEELEF